MINQLDKNNNNFPNDFIDAGDFICSELLKEVYAQNNLIFTKNNFKNKTLKQKYKIINFLKKAAKITGQIIFKSKVSSYKKIENLKNEKTTIAINFIEGHDNNKRSDLFWFEGSDIKPSSILVYFENPNMMNRHGNRKNIIEYLEKLGVNWIKLWKYRNNIANTPLDPLLEKLKVLSPKNKTEKWLLKQIKQLSEDVIYWYLFFKKFNIKIHTDPIEFGSKAIVKQIALDILGGCSVGKLRSYPNNIKQKNKGEYLGYYPNDIFFTWGTDSSNRISKTTNKIDNILISGFPYKTQSKYIKKNLNKIETQFKDNGVKFTVLLLDNNHSNNKGLIQLIETEHLKDFYMMLNDLFYFLRLLDTF